MCVCVCVCVDIFKLDNKRGGVVISVPYDFKVSNISVPREDIFYAAKGFRACMSGFNVRVCARESASMYADSLVCTNCAEMLTLTNNQTNKQISKHKTEQVILCFNVSMCGFILFS